MLFRTAMIIAFLAVTTTFAADTASFRAKVIRVLDGDTIEVLKDKAPHRTRLYGIDWPEHDQDFGTRARFYVK